FAEDKIVAVIAALPEPFAVLALMDRGIEFGNREKLTARDEASLVAKSPEIGKQILDVAGCEVAILALEHQQWRVLPEDPLRAPENPEFGALDVDLEQRDPIVLTEIFIQRDQRHRQRRKARRLLRLAMKRRPGLMAFRDKQILMAAMRVHGLGFDLHIAKLDRPAGVGDRARQL